MNVLNGSVSGRGGYWRGKGMIVESLRRGKTLINYYVLYI